MMTMTMYIIKSFVKVNFRQSHGGPHTLLEASIRSEDLREMEGKRLIQALLVKYGTQVWTRPEEVGVPSPKINLKLHLCRKLRKESYSDWKDQNASISN